MEIVDGNNVIGRLGGGSRDALVEALSALCRARRKAVVVVFDGPPEAGRGKVQSLGFVTVVCAAPLSADAEILRRVSESHDGRGLTVVTDDRALASAVAAAGGRTVGVEPFRRLATKRLSGSVGAGPAVPEPREKPALPGRAKDWEVWFSDDGNRLR